MVRLDWITGYPSYSDVKTDGQFNKTKEIRN